ncbi:MAG: DUF2177 family protein, partial [bacterium]
LNSDKAKKILKFQPTIDIEQGIPEYIDWFCDQKFYKDNLNGLMSKKPIWSIAILFYGVFIFGLMYFVIVPSLSSGSYKTLLTRAAIFGFVTYATYDLTNLSTLKNWPKNLTAVDLVWGVVLSSLVSLVAFTVAKKLFS